MKHHIMIAGGLLMLAIFGAQAASALSEPGLGLREAYVAGGVVIAGWLIAAGFAERRGARRNSAPVE